VKFDTADHALCHGNTFRIKYEFLGAVTREEVEHA